MLSACMRIPDLAVWRIGLNHQSFQGNMLESLYVLLGFEATAINADVEI
jgi:hypothetical protein